MATPGSNSDRTRRFVAWRGGDDEHGNTKAPLPHLPPSHHFTGQWWYSIDLKYREGVRPSWEMVNVANFSSKGIKENLFIFFPLVQDDLSKTWEFLFDLFSKYLWRAYCVWTVILGARSWDKEILALKGIYSLSEETPIYPGKWKGMSKQDGEWKYGR